MVLRSFSMDAVDLQHIRIGSAHTIAGGVCVSMITRNLQPHVLHFHSVSDPVPSLVPAKPNPESVERPADNLDSSLR